MTWAKTLSQQGNSPQTSLWIDVFIHINPNEYISFIFNCASWKHKGKHFFGLRIIMGLFLPKLFIISYFQGKNSAIVQQQKWACNFYLQEKLWPVKSSKPEAMRPGGVTMRRIALKSKTGFFFQIQACSGKNVRLQPAAGEINSSAGPDQQTTKSLTQRAPFLTSLI